jgi:hypothetical protein
MDEWKKAAVNAATDSHVPFRAFFCGGKMNCAFFFGTKKIAIHVSKTKLNCTGRGEISVSRQKTKRGRFSLQMYSTGTVSRLILSPGGPKHCQDKQGLTN